MMTRAIAIAYVAAPSASRIMPCRKTVDARRAAKDGFVRSFAANALVGIDGAGIRGIVAHSVERVQ